MLLGTVLKTEIQSSAGHGLHFLTWSSPVILNSRTVSGPTLKETCITCNVIPADAWFVFGGKSEHFCGEMGFLLLKEVVVLKLFKG